jgi:hypothetical protein
VKQKIFGGVVLLLAGMILANDIRVGLAFVAIGFYIWNDAG